MIFERSSSYIGRTVGEFVLEERIGEGGGGVVFRAAQPMLQRAAVVKLHPSANEPERIAKFLQEARLASRLDHPFAAHVYAFGAESDGLLWIAMELVRGTPLATLLERGPLDRGLELIERICEVVQSTHELGIVHGDLKPSNIMVIARGGNLFPKLLDFGIARDLSDSVSGGIGTPMYMAPEQWIPGRSLTPETDIYALGALAFEVLTGRPPFTANTRMEFAKHHARTPPPTLPDNFPQRISAAITKAMAKSPTARFASASELANALRGDATLGSLNVPRLDELTRDDALLGMPEPIGDAVVALDAVTDAESAYVGAWGLARTIAQYLGAVALGCRARIRGVDSDPVRALLGSLRATGLDAKSWWRLTRELVRPFAGMRDAYPVPELVELFFDGAAEVTTALDLAIADRGTPLDHPTRDVALAELARIMPALGTTLRSLHWLAAYRLSAPARMGAQILAGPRRNERPMVELGTPLTAPALLGHNDAIVVDLAGIAQHHSPIPGAPRRIFVLDGPGRHGARLRALPDTLEHEVDDSWQRHGIGDDDVDRERAEAISPYMGLATFTEQQSALFFGRERELEELLNRLAADNRVAIVGPSGAGKSSFIRAGLFPALGATWKQLVLRPGTAPLTSLISQLSALTGTAPTAAELVRQPSKFGAALSEYSAAQKVVLFVDQFEELFTLSSDPVEQAAFAAALVLAASANERVRLVLTLRDDFLLRAAQQPALASIASWLQLLTTPAPADLHRILVEPARRGGYVFEDEEFPDQIIAELANQPAALALLSFTAAQLWTLRDRHAQQLTRRAYRALGGVGGALAQHAESVLDSLPAAQQKTVRELFRQLVTAEGTRSVLSREELTQVGGGADALPVIERLITERLLTAMEIPGGESIEVVHETLLVSWPRLVQWRAQDADNARLRDQLRSAARQWEDRGRPRGLLWRSDALAEYRLWRNRYPGSITALEEAFSRASINDSTRGRRIRRGLLAVAGVSLIAALIVFARLRSDAVASGTQARNQLLDSYREQAERALAAGDAFGALVFLEGSSQLGVDSFAHHFMVSRAIEAVTPKLATMQAHAGLPPQIAFEPDGSLISASTDGVLRRWGVDGTLLWSQQAYASGADILVVVSPDGRWIATGAAAGVDLRAPDGSIVKHLGGHDAQLFRGAFSNDSKRLVTSASDGTARIWDPDTGESQLLDLGTHARAVAAINGDYVIVGSSGVSEDGVFEVWSPGMVAAPVPIEVTHRQLINVAVSSDGQQAAIGTAEGAIELWDVGKRRLVRALTGHSGPISLLLYAPDGTLVSGSTDGSLRTWNPTNGEALRVLGDHLGQIRAGGIDSHGRLFSSSTNGTAKLWDVASGTNLRTFAHGGAVLVAINQDGTRLATSSSLGTIELWRVDADVGVDLLDGAAPDPADNVPWVSVDGSRLARASANGGELWDLLRRRLITRHGDAKTLVTGDGDRVYFADPDAITIAAASDGHVLATIAAPFAIAQICVEPGTTRFVVATNPPGSIAVLDGTGKVLATARGEDQEALICEPGALLAHGKDATFFALPDLSVVRTEKLPSLAVGTTEPGVGIVDLSGRSELEVCRKGQRVTTLRYSGLIMSTAASAGVLAVGLSDGTIVERALGSWEPRSEIKAHGAPVAALAGNDRLLASVSLDGTLQIREHGVQRALYSAEVSSTSYWLHFAGDLLVLTDGSHVELRRVGIVPMAAGRLAELVACGVPAEVRAQLGGPPASATCHGAD